MGKKLKINELNQGHNNIGSFFETLFSQCLADARLHLSIVLSFTVCH